MSTTPMHSLPLQVTAQTKQSLEEGAKRLNLTISAYVAYLIARQQAGPDAARLDRMVHEVFGRYGSTMRKLAE